MLKRGLVVDISCAMGQSPLVDEFYIRAYLEMRDALDMRILATLGLTLP